MVVADGLAREADGLEQVERPRGGDVGGVVGDLEGDGDVQLRGEVVDLVGANGVERRGGTRSRRSRRSGAASGAAATTTPRGGRGRCGPAAAC